ncbi:MAG: sensory box protein [Hydrocarboniphaga sp.]|uniref:MHYT domain-containing protein n=1 Tax=Hydrocarboniphaga sp. TaxID=2033016 RepID=UPI0026190B7F|nr:MHYT domain-containing protein [Hydrocarboniphaga sp.]MDB5970455.1 sensory box protein [Hydrocarboniphaga sp.]
MSPSYNLILVLLSYIVAVSASFVALDMAGRVSSSTGKTVTRLWLGAGACAMGLGIWSMHFVGMLALRLPIAVSYDLADTALSALFAVAASAIALNVLRTGDLPLARLLPAGVAMGSGIVAMHYSGMAALQVLPGPRYNPVLVTASMVIAVGASIVALYIAARLRRETIVTAFREKAGGALVMGMAITGMHYTGMAATAFAPDTICFGDPSKLSNGMIASAVGVCVLLFLTGTLLAALTDARLAERTVALARSTDQNLELEARVLERTAKVRESEHALHAMMQNATRDRDKAEAALAELQRAVTQRTQLEDRVREQASLLDKARDAIVVRGIDSRILYWNQGAERIYGWAAGEVLGLSAETLLHRDPAEYGAAMAALIETGEWRGRIVQQRKDGSTLIVERHSTLVRDEEGRPKSVLSISTDITKRVSIEEQLQQSQRLETVGQLTGGVAHDFNNLLTVILGNAEILVEQLEAQPQLRMLAEMNCSAARRGADLTHRLLAFARCQALEPSSVDVVALVANMAALLKQTMSEAIIIQRSSADTVPPALVDPSQLENAILNLCINARDSMAGMPSRHITISIDQAVLDSADISGHIDVSAGHYVRVAVSDNGLGIAQQNLKRVFDPFFTTKEFGKGTGLGLSMVYGFVKQSHGHVSIESEVGKGTSVQMYLPISQQPASAAAAGPVAKSATVGGSETVLLVEDEELLRIFAKTQLDGLGYRVITAANGDVALEAMRLNPDIDLLFTDVVMPGGMNGADLARAARKIQPDLKVLYTSGYTDNAALTQCGLSGEVHFLGKPYQRAELAQKLRSALATPVCETC